jgi:hypothetical protein
MDTLPPTTLDKVRLVTSRRAGCIGEYTNICLVHGNVSTCLCKVIFVGDSFGNTAVLRLVLRKRDEYLLLLDCAEAILTSPTPHNVPLNKVLF